MSNSCKIINFTKCLPFCLKNVAPKFQIIVKFESRAILRINVKKICKMLTFCSKKMLPLNPKLFYYYKTEQNK